MLHGVRSHGEKNLQVTCKSMVIIICRGRPTAGISQPTITRSKLTKETPEQCVTYVES